MPILGIQKILHRLQIALKLVEHDIQFVTARSHWH